MPSLKSLPMEKSKMIVIRDLLTIIPKYQTPRTFYSQPIYGKDLVFNQLPHLRTSCVLIADYYYLSSGNFYPRSPDDEIAYHIERDYIVIWVADSFQDLQTRLSLIQYETYQPANIIFAYIDSQPKQGIYICPFFTSPKPRLFNPTLTTINDIIWKH